jgi:TrmH family RNA methyltransferase
VKISPVSSAQNATLKRIRALHQRSARDKEGLFLLEGAKLLNEALAKGVSVLDVVVSKSFWTEGMPFVDQSNIAEMHVVEDKIFKELMTTNTPSGIIAVARTQQHTLSDSIKNGETLVVVGEAIQDPGNAGTLIRASAAFGASAVVLTRGSVDAYNPKVVRAAMGALFHLPVIVGLDTGTVLSQLKQSGFRVLALDPGARDRPLATASFKRPLAVVLGNEGNGLSAEAMKAADDLVAIKMSDTTESLNVAVCGSIVLYECARQFGSLGC